MSSAPTPQPQRNNAVWWILAIIGGGIVLLVAFALLVGGVFIRHLTVKESGKKVVIDTPVGTLRVNGEETHPTGLPIYPGATAGQSEGTSVEFSGKEGGGGGLATENYTTSDNLDQVAAWYAQKLGPKYRREERGEGSRRTYGPGQTHADVAFINDTGEGARIVALNRKSHAVEITLLRIGKKEIQ